MKVKRLKNEIRYIKIDRDAIFERLREDMIDQAENYFRILDFTKVNFKYFWDPDTDEFMCAVCDGDLQLDSFFLETILKEKPITTHTLYSTKCYSSILIDDCNNIQ